MKKNVIIASLIGLIVINVVADYYETTVEEKLEIERIKADNRLKKLRNQTDKSISKSIVYLIMKILE